MKITLFILHTFLFLLLCSATAEASPLQPSFWRFEFDNDYFLNKDNKLSDGIALQWHSAAFADWQERDDILARIGSWLPGLTAPTLRYRNGIAVGQIIQTPNDLSQSTLIRTDVPYAGALTTQINWYGFNAEQLRAMEVVIGVLGPASLGGITQKTVHQFSGNGVPQGWHNQLSNEPLLGINILRKQRLSHGGHPAQYAWDVAVGGCVTAGNLLTQASIDLDLRFGLNMPSGFNAAPDPIGLNIHYMATLPAAEQQRASIYATATMRGTAVARNIFLDGNTFRRSHHIKKRPLVLWSFFGLHYAQRQWRLHLYAMVSSDNVYVTTASQAEKGERGASIMFEWLY
jgi:hypothetical protein